MKCGGAQNAIYKVSYTYTHTRFPFPSFFPFFFFFFLLFFDKDSYQISYSPIMDEISIKLGLGMTTGRVRGGFLYNQTCLVGLPPLPEPALFNKRVFLKLPNLPCQDPAGPVPSCPTQNHKHKHQSVQS